VHSIGLTGGIGTGKSTVARLFADRGAAICDADEEAHALLAPGGGAVEAVVRSFGSEVLGADGGIDRERLGRLVFADTEARARLEAISHPLIARRLAEAARQALERGAPVFLVEAALLVETGRHRDFQTLVVVRADPERVRTRVAARDRLSADELDARIAAQTSEAERLAVADHVIDNGGSLEDTERQVKAIWRAVTESPG